MFTTEVIRDRIRQAPFVPLRIVTTLGQSYDIHDPELVLFGRGFLLICTPASDYPGLIDQVIRLALVHVVELRDLPTNVASAN